MRRLYTYNCPSHGLRDMWADPEDREIAQLCSLCGLESTYQISAPAVILPGWCNTFPSASLKWEERHIKGAQEIPQSE